MIFSYRAYSEEIIISIGDGPVEEELLFDNLPPEDIKKMQDGSMLTGFLTDIDQDLSSSDISNTSYADPVSDVSENKESLSSENVSADNGSLSSENVSADNGSLSSEDVSANKELIDAWNEGTDQSETFLISGTNDTTNNSLSGNESADSGLISENLLISETQSIIYSNNSSALSGSSQENIISDNNYEASEKSSVFIDPASFLLPQNNSSDTQSILSITETRLRESVINYASQFLGNPYVYGGTSLTSGADCSGFVQEIFKNFGITTGRTSRDQYQNSARISESDLRTGDLVFYATNGYVNHVAIYAGNQVIIHAASRSAGICTSYYNYRTPYGYGRFL